MIEKKDFYINGKWVSPAKPNDFEVINPSTEEAFAIISLGSTEDANKAINAAKIAFETWRETTKEERLALLEKFDYCHNKTGPDCCQFFLTNGFRPPLLHLDYLMLF